MKSKLPILSLILILLLLINSNVCFAQEFHGSVSTPVYNGGLKALKEFIVKNTQYSGVTDKDGITGIVTVAYTINKSGEIENIKILRGLNAKCDSEAIRMTRLITGWQAAVQWGKPISMRVTMPIEFKVKADAQKDNQVIVTGYVYDKATGKPLPGTLVIVKGTNIGAVSNDDGLYSISIPGENNELEYSSLGYGIKSEKVGLNHTLIVELVPENFALDFTAN